MSKKTTSYDYTGHSEVIENGNDPPPRNERWYDVTTAVDADGNESRIIENGNDPERRRR